MDFKEKQKTLGKRINKLRKFPTKEELIVKRYLEDNDIYFIFQKAFIKGNCYCIVDFYIPKPFKVVIEVDGGYHFTEEQYYYDKWRDRYLTDERKFKVIRIKNEDVNDGKFISFLNHFFLKVN